MENSTAEEIMTPRPRTVDRHQTVAKAVEVMSSEHCGIVPVTASGSDRTLVGIVTDRDIALRACSDGAHGPDESIEKVMSSKNLYCASPGDDLSRVSEIMQRAAVRRVPVVDADNRIVGIISLKDLASRIDARKLGDTDDLIYEQEPND